MVPRARNGRYGELGNRTARVPGGWVRWIGWIGVRDAGRDLCGVDHLRHAQPYVPTATENGWAGRGRYSRDCNIFRDARAFSCFFLSTSRAFECTKLQMNKTLTSLTLTLP